ncbi:hypothetical protein [Paenibacillus sedimenti]|uniref:Uncharacterized protein n=1 Tax=Paenibacillus sedimenti TaxID=2770274 RepID=A0A926KSA2_9BACL|nr:hypothetical protein [Paenibacillus sedimenti]MBD0383177.1 hypothetical protein [Paenibacillus sedimenti]
MKPVKIALYLLFIACICYVQIVELIRNKEKKDAFFYTGFMLTAAVIGSLFIAGVPVPSPYLPLKAVFEPVGKWFFPKK